MSAPVQMRFPFNEDELFRQLTNLRLALLRSGKYRRILSQEEQPVRDFGERLFNALMLGDVRSLYDQSLGIAKAQKKGLRLKLNIESPEMATLPWEFLYDSGGSNRYLCLSRRTPVVRSFNLKEPDEPLTVTPPLRILGMVVSPKGLSRLDLEHEKELVNEALASLQESGLVELVWAKGKTWQDLQSEMQGGPWHVFHFIGHGCFDSTQDEGLIALAENNRNDSPPFFLSALKLGLLLNDHDSLRLVMLNSCEGAKGNETNIFSSTAAKLMEQGIPAVVAMQYEITDKAAIVFSRSFYGAIANGLPVDAATTEARKAINISEGHTVEWGTPVLYMLSPNGIIFDINLPSGEERKQEKIASLMEGAGVSSANENWEQTVKELQSVLALEPAHEEAASLIKQARNRLELAAFYDEGEKLLSEHRLEDALACFQSAFEKDRGYRDLERLIRNTQREIKKGVSSQSLVNKWFLRLRDRATSAPRYARALFGAVILLVVVGFLLFSLPPQVVHNSQHFIESCMIRLNAGSYPPRFPEEGWGDDFCFKPDCTFVDSREAQPDTYKWNYPTDKWKIVEGLDNDEADGDLLISGWGLGAPNNLNGQVFYDFKFDFEVQLGKANRVFWILRMQPDQSEIKGYVFELVKSGKNLKVNYYLHIPAADEAPLGTILLPFTYIEGGRIYIEASVEHYKFSYKFRLAEDPNIVSQGTKAEVGYDFPPIDIPEKTFMNQNARYRWGNIGLLGTDPDSVIRIEALHLRPFKHQFDF